MIRGDGSGDVILLTLGMMLFSMDTPEDSGVFQPTGERFAGFIEGQSNLQSAKRGTGKDADRLSNPRIKTLIRICHSKCVQFLKHRNGGGSKKLTLLDQTEDGR